MVNPFDYHALASMRNVTQYSDVEFYYSYFDFLRVLSLCQFPGICEAYFLSKFINGRKIKIQVYVLQHHPSNLLDAYELALIQEYALRNEKNIQVTNHHKHHALVADPQSFDEILQPSIIDNNLGGGSKEVSIGTGCSQEAHCYNETATVKFEVLLGVAHSGVSTVHHSNNMIAGGNVIPAPCVSSYQLSVLCNFPSKEEDEGGTILCMTAFLAYALNQNSPAFSFDVLGDSIRTLTVVNNDIIADISLALAWEVLFQSDKPWPQGLTCLVKRFGYAPPQFSDVHFLVKDNSTLAAENFHPEDTLLMPSSAILYAKNVKEVTMSLQSFQQGLSPHSSADLQCNHTGVPSSLYLLADSNIRLDKRLVNTSLCFDQAFPDHHFSASVYAPMDLLYTHRSSLSGCLAAYCSHIQVYTAHACLLGTECSSPLAGFQYNRSSWCKRPHGFLQLLVEEAEKASIALQRGIRTCCIRVAHSVCRHSALYRGIKSITPHYFLQDSSVAGSLLLLLTPGLVYQDRHKALLSILSFDPGILYPSATLSMAGISSHNIANF